MIDNLVEGGFWLALAVIKVTNLNRESFPGVNIAASHAPRCESYSLMVPQKLSIGHDETADRVI